MLGGGRQIDDQHGAAWLDLDHVAAVGDEATGRRRSGSHLQRFALHIGLVLVVLLLLGQVLLLLLLVKMLHRHVAAEAAQRL